MQAKQQRAIVPTMSHSMGISFLRVPCFAYRLQRGEHEGILGSRISERREVGMRGGAKRRSPGLGSSRKNESQ